MFERGALLLVPFPFTDLSTSKRRPVLALTCPDGYGDFVALPITSRPQAAHGLALVQADLAEGGLPAPSWIRTDRIVTLNVSLVVKSFGRARDETRDRAINALCDRLRGPGS